ncbi:PP2C family protein-serine/threonine phosphatase [Nocardioides litoris]|uniref:PP2C family protein-serine/threonine phosphatase n=1 Tax=Nocardioides litoris TaxID=1926648 RepID=UPI001121E41F|nr:protein phosphatase 2C domain-containing protein [Nocardioides litoris]
MLQMVAAAGSHPGLRRATNEDSGYAGPSLLLVADGVGGSQAGEVASATATLAVARLAARRRGLEPVATLDAAVREAREALVAHEQEHAGDQGLSTTLTAVLTDGRRCALVHLGDSRAYVLRRGRFASLTRDHTLTASMLRAGLLTPQQAEVSEHRHRITRWLGTQGVGDELEPDLGRLELEVGDRVVLCTDGVTDHVEDGALARLVAGGTPEEVVARLVGAGLDGGGRDNLTVVVGDVVERGAIATGGRVVGAAAEPVRAAVR